LILLRRSPVTAFTFSVEQLRAAPPEVRRWFAEEIAQLLGSVQGPHPEPRQPERMKLAACTAAEALQIFELIGNDAIAARLFFELAREGAISGSLPGLHALRTADLLHHAGLPGQESLISGLTLIDRAFRQIRGDNAGRLFGFDEAGHVFIHETTQLSIRRLWQELVEARAIAERQAAGETAPRSDGFIAPRVGPSEDVVTHTARPPAGAEHQF
jgi:hypothetical protein